MKYMVETKVGCEILDCSYEQAEIFCYFHGINPEEIYEITDELAEEILG